MKTAICTWIMIAVIPAYMTAQSTVNYNYDEAGNRVKRWLTTSKQLIAPDSSNKTTVPEDIQSFILASENQGESAVVENPGTGEARVFPNPVKEFLEIQPGNSFRKGYEVLLYDGSGKVFYSSKSVMGNTQINMSRAMAGPYYLALIPKDGKRIYWKLIKE